MEEDRKRIVAYHEAGHAAIHWMFARGYAIDFIDMRGNRDDDGFIRSDWSCTAILDPQAFHQSFLTRDDAAKRVITLDLKEYMLYLLAGFAAESRVSGDGVSRFELEMGFGFWEDIKRHDIYRANAASVALYGRNGRACPFLYKMAKWADEAMQHRQLWAVVEQLAERLQRIKRRLSGPSAVKIMERAWDGRDGIPCMKMGRKWRRRFPIEIPPKLRNGATGRPLPKC